ncbi:hypothetical protein [Hyphomicrobium sp. 1Nfss2.1]|uniref:hypothetical protein n=1 Tax=Hyphomicrobium sp. 1Nfss2.1 TaxID=3413936 RepID=UPI003C7CDED3
MAKGLTRKFADATLMNAANPTPKECRLAIRDGDIAGRVTSIVRSPTLGQAIDLRPEKFADLSVVQTSIAKMPAILTRADIGGRTVFHLLVDSAAALYFCDCLLDAAAEFGGRIAGLDVLQKFEDV